MRFTNKFLTVLAITTILNIGDLCSTYYVTPDLKNEGNYWVVKYSLGWPGLIFVLITYQVLNLLFFYYHSDVFKKRDYTKRKNNSIAEVFKIYLFNSSKPKLNIYNLNELGKAISNYLGIHLMLNHIIIKLHAIIDNTLAGFFDHLPKVKFIGIKDGITNFEINCQDPYWKSDFGKFLLNYVTLKKEMLDLFLEITLIEASAILLVIFLIKTYYTAILTPKIEGN